MAPERHRRTSRSLPPLDSSVENTTLAVLCGSDEPGASKALDVSIPKSQLEGDGGGGAKAGWKLRRELRKSTDHFDFSIADDEAGAKIAEAPPPAAEKKKNDPSSFRARRLSKESIGVDPNKAGIGSTSARTEKPTSRLPAAASSPDKKTAAGSGFAAVKQLGATPATAPERPPSKGSADAAAAAGGPSSGKSAAGGFSTAVAGSSSEKAGTKRLSAPHEKAEEGRRSPRSPRRNSPAPRSSSAVTLPTFLVAKEFEEVDEGKSDGDGGWQLAHGLDSTKVGLLSCHGAEPSKLCAAIAKDKINQDCACVCSGVGGHPGAAIFCVFDGHGACGREVSQAAMHAVKTHMERNELLMRRPVWALADAFAHVQSALRALPKATADADDSGACALVTYMRDRTLWVAGAGDTRAVLGTRASGVLAAVALSTDHKVSVPAEAARIQAAGGFVRMGDSATTARVYADKTMCNGPGLAIARALGDCGASEIGVIATPEVITHRLTPDDRFLIIASDGVWEFIGSHEAVQIVDAFLAKGKGVTDACHHLIAKAAEAWFEVEGAYRDDITASIIWLQPVADALEKAAAAAS